MRAASLGDDLQARLAPSLFVHVDDGLHVRPLPKGFDGGAGLAYASSVA